MNYIQLQKELNSGVILPAYLFLSYDAYIANSYVSLIRKKILFGDLASLNESLFNEKKVEANELRAALEALPVMAEKRLVIIKPDAYAAIAQSSALSDVLCTYLAAPNAYCVLIALCPKADKRTRLFKAFSSLAKTVEFAHLSDTELSEYIKNNFAQKKLNVDKNAVSFLMQAVDYNGRDASVDLGYIVNEINKLSAYASANNLKSLKEEDFEEVVSVNTSKDIYRYTDSIISGDLKAALVQMNRLLVNKVPLQLIMYSLDTILRQNAIWSTASASGASETQIAKKYGANPYIVKKTLLKSRVSAEAYLKAIKTLSEEDFKIKQGLSDIQTSLLTITFKLCALAK